MVVICSELRPAFVVYNEPMSIVRIITVALCMTAAGDCIAQEEPPPAPAPPPQVAQPLPPPPIVVEVDGRIVVFPTAQPKVYAGRVLVPLRGVFQEIGAYVEFDSVARKIKARMGNEEIELRVGDRLARKNGAEIMMDIPPMIDGGATMVPLRFLAEALGAKVTHLKLLNKVIIETALNQDDPVSVRPS